MKYLVAAFCLIVVCLHIPQAYGLDAVSENAKGTEIALAADKRDQGWIDSSGTMVMTLVNHDGKTRVRELRAFNLEVIDDGDKSLSVFDAPRDLAGTAVLTWSGLTTPDDQWIYLPANRRVKRINSRNKASAFMGSEFAYEDISSQEPQKYHYRYLGNEPCDGASDCYVLERKPAYKYSGYTRQVVWMDIEHYRIWRIDFFDRKDSLLKTLRFSDYQEYVERYWRATTLKMQNHRSGRSTTLQWKDLSFQNGLTERDFHQSTLTRAR